MAGIYERVKDTAENNVSISAIYESLFLRGIGEYTGQQAEDAVNSSTSVPLNAAETTDITDLLANILAEPDNISKLIFLNKARAVLRQWEQGAPAMTEVKGRTILGI